MTSVNWVEVICAAVVLGSLAAHLFIWARLNRLYRLWNEMILEDCRRRDVHDSGAKGKTA
jgi:hypothetical protein